MKEKKVFLGGTCCESTWRDELIPMLKIDYFNPVVEDWTPECQAEEYRQKDICKYQVYVITPKIKGYFSIAEIIDSCFTPGTKTFIYIKPTEIINENIISWSKEQEISLKAVCDLAEKRGGIICQSLEDMASKLNSAD